MEIRGIDVSAWQGKIDWKTVADYSMGFAILRITEAGNVIDSYFEQNFSECRKYNIPVGAYKYSYAMTVAEIQSEARKVVEVLNGRNCSIRSGWIWNGIIREASELNRSINWQKHSKRLSRQRDINLVFIAMWIGT